MKRRITALALIVVGLLAPSMLNTASAAEKKYTIALTPGLTTDPFYITMHKGAEEAAKVLGVNLVFQGAPDFNPVTQVPVLNAIIGRKPDAILIAPTDKNQLVEPLKKAMEAGIPVITVDTFIGTGHYQTGSGDADFPISYVASDNVLGGAIAARALAKAIGDKGKVYVSNVKPGISTTDQREQGFKAEMKKHPNITSWTRSLTTTTLTSPQSPRQMKQTANRTKFALLPRRSER
jgi:ribose transport system substrate-binding protein